GRAEEHRTLRPWRRPERPHDDGPADVDAFLLPGLERVDELAYPDPLHQRPGRRRRGRATIDGAGRPRVAERRRTDAARGRADRPDVRGIPPGGATDPRPPRSSAESCVRRRPLREERAESLEAAERAGRAD